MVIFLTHNILFLNNYIHIAMNNKLTNNFYLMHAKVIILTQIKLQI